MGQSLQSARLYQTDPRAMAERLMEFKPASDAEALKLLRASFPEAPLSLRVAALAFLSRKQFPADPSQVHH